MRTGLQLQVGRNGGGETKIDGLRAGTWYTLQVETVFGAGTSLRVWLNNANHAAPTRTFSGLNSPIACHNLFMLGYQRELGAAWPGALAPAYGASWRGSSSLDGARLVRMRGVEAGQRPRHDGDRDEQTGRLLRRSWQADGGGRGGRDTTCAIDSAGRARRERAGATQDSTRLNARTNRNGG